MLWHMNLFKLKLDLPIKEAYKFQNHKKLL